MTAVKAGRLHRAGVGRGSWTERWCVLHPAELVFSSGPDAADVLGRVALTDVESVAAHPAQAGHAHCFVVTVRPGSVPKTHVFAAASARERDDWVTVIHRALDAQGSPAPATKASSSPSLRAPGVVRPAPAASVVRPPPLKSVASATQLKTSSPVSPRSATAPSLAARPALSPSAAIAAIAAKPRPPAPPLSLAAQPPAPTARKTVRALYAYAATNGEELTFAEGDEITVLAEEAEWIQGELRGRHGWAPKTYIEFQSPAGTARREPQHVSDSGYDATSYDTFDPTEPVRRPAVEPMRAATVASRRNVRVLRYERRKDTMTKESFYLFVIDVDGVLLYRRVTEFRQLWTRVCEQSPPPAAPEPPITKESMLTNYSKLAGELDEWLHVLLDDSQWSRAPVMVEFLSENSKDVIYRKTGDDGDASAATASPVPSSGGWDDNVGFSKDASRDQMRNASNVRDIKAKIVRTVKVSESMLDRHYEYEIRVDRDGTIYTIYRRYAEWYAFHERLLAQFPGEGGQMPGSQRIIPYMPGKKVIGLNGYDVAMSRMVAMQEYFEVLLRLEKRIAHCTLVLDFLARRDKDSDPHFLASVAAA